MRGEDGDGVMDQQQHAAYLAAYELFEAVQSERHTEALAELTPARRHAEQRGWRDVEFVLAAAETVHALSRPETAGLPAAHVALLVERAEALEAPALLAIALGLRALAAASVGDTSGLMADASRAVALLDDDQPAALDRSTGYVIVAAAFNTLRLWELVDELYTRAHVLGLGCDVSVQAPAIAVNRVLTRIEWALALLENGDEQQSAARLTEALDAVPAALDQQLPPLWRHDVEACVLVVRLLRGERPSTLDPELGRCRQDLVEGDDLEVLPLLDAAVSLALWRAGETEAAVTAAERLAPSSAPSSGSRSFPLWVRARVMTGAVPPGAARALEEHAALLGRLRANSRQAVLVAARAQIAAERRQGEHEQLSRAVNTDPLTGLLNRRSFDAWLDGRSPRRRRPTALLLIDLDGFKQVNDVHGHDYGDEVLRRFARLLLASVRSGDLAVRHGGDEFAILLEHDRLTLGAAEQRARDLLAAVAEEPWSRLAVGLAVTASIGLAVATGQGADQDVDPRALYRAADAALYAAKRDGCGLVVDAGPVLSTPVRRADGAANGPASRLADAG